MENFYPISAVCSRKMKRKTGCMSFGESMYPLRQFSLEKNTYDFENLKECVYHWNNFSSSVGENWLQLMRLYETVDMYGSKDQLQECTDIICSNIIPYLPSPSMIKKDVYRRIQECKSDHMKSCLYSMMDPLNEGIECDRLLNNYDVISKRYNINKIVQSNILYEDAVTDTIYSICGLIDTYDLDYRTKFCIAAESTLYSVYNSIGNDPIEEEYLSKKLDQTALLESVFDYFLINYGRLHFDQFIQEMSNTCHKDPFIRDRLDPYMERLNRIHAQTMIENVSPIPLSEIQIRYPEEALYGMTRDIDQYRDLRENARHAIHEASFEEIRNKAREWMDKIKMAPSQSVNMVKQALAAIFVPCRAEDLGKGTHNALSFLFYALVILGTGISAGAFGIIFGSLFTYMTAKVSQKIYLKDAIQEWRDHQYSVERKIKDCTDMEKKRRMEAYLDQVKQTRIKLEDKYESIRDKTMDEINKKAEEDKANNKTSITTFIKTDTVNPQGKVTPTSDLYDPNKKNHVQLMSGM